MSKELSPLEALKRIRQETIPATYNQDFDKEECCNIIETALKRLEKIDDTKLIIIGNPSPNESTLNKLINERMYVGDPQEMEIKPLYDEVIDKKLKALEIIKETPIFAWYVTIYKDAYEMIADAKGFRVNESAEELQEKFDLLKEVLL